jgi:hypothetical protein
MFLVRAAFWIMVVAVFMPPQGELSFSDDAGVDVTAFIRMIAIDNLNRVKRELMDADEGYSTPPSNDVQAPKRDTSPPRTWQSTAFLGAVPLFPKRL